jgi:multidrug efflux pump subunit AcrA (membrane-fusion protein)
LWEQKIGSEVQYINAKASRDGLQRSIATLKTQLNQTVIVAPISGTVDNVNARVGESSQHPAGLFRIVNLSQLKITGDIAEAYQPYLKNGSAVEVEFPELHLIQSGKISFVSSIINPTSRTITLEAKVPNTSKLRPNMIAKLRVNDQTLPTTISIDQNLVQTSEQGEKSPHRMRFLGKCGKMWKKFWENWAARHRKYAQILIWKWGNPNRQKQKF